MKNTAKYETTAEVKDWDTGEAKKVKVGDWVCFKCDVEQQAEIVGISSTTNWEYVRTLTLKAPADGFDGGYLEGHDTFDILANEAWL